MFIEPTERTGLIDKLRQKLGKELNNSELRLELTTLELQDIIEIRQTLTTPGWEIIRRLAKEEITEHEKQMIKLTPNQMVSRLTLLGHWAIAEGLSVWLRKIESALRKRDKLEKELDGLTIKVKEEKETPMNRMGMFIKKNAEI